MLKDITRIMVAAALSLTLMNCGSGASSGGGDSWRKDDNDKVQQNSSRGKRKIQKTQESIEL